MAFRSVPRPSSPPGAKASTERPSLALSHAKSTANRRLPILHRNHPTLSQELNNNPIHMPPSCHRCENNGAKSTDAPSSTSILLTLLNTTRLRGLGSLARSSSGQTCNRRVQTRQTLIHMSKEQKTNPPQRTGPHPRDHGPATSVRGSAPCSHDLLSHRDGVSPKMEVDGIEPTTPCLQSRCSPTELHPQETNSRKFFGSFF